MKGGRQGEKKHSNKAQSSPDNGQAISYTRGGGKTKITFYKMFGTYQQITATEKKVGQQQLSIKCWLLRSLLLEDIAKCQVYLLLDSLCRSSTHLEAILGCTTWWLSLYRRLFTCSFMWMGDFLHANIFFPDPQNRDMWVCLCLYWEKPLNCNNYLALTDTTRWVQMNLNNGSTHCCSGPCISWTLKHFLKNQGHCSRRYTLACILSLHS